MPGPTSSRYCIYSHTLHTGLLVSTGEFTMISNIRFLNCRPLVYSNISSESSSPSVFLSLHSPGQRLPFGVSGRCLRVESVDAFVSPSPYRQYSRALNLTSTIFPELRTFYAISSPKFVISIRECANVGKTSTRTGQRVGFEVGGMWANARGCVGVNR